LNDEQPRDLRRPNAALPLGAPAEEDASAQLRGTPREVLRRLCEGDPLGLAARCDQHLRSSGILLDAARLLPATAARVAHDAHMYRDEDSLDDFLERCIQSAARLLLQRDLEAHRSGLPAGPPGDPRLVALASTLGLEPALLPTTMLRINCLPRPVRRAFRALFLDGLTPGEHARQAGSTRPEVLANARLALEVVARRGRPDRHLDRSLGLAQLEGRGGSDRG